MISKRKNSVTFSALFVLLGIWAVFLVVGFDGLYGQDSYEYLRYTERMKEFFLSGVHPGDFFWPKGYPLITGLISMLVPTKIALQLVSVVSLWGTFIYTKKLIEHYVGSDKYASFYVLIGLVLSPYMLRAGVSSMSDLLALFCLVGGFYHGLKFAKNHSFSALFLCVLLITFSVFTRYAAVVPAIPMVVFVVWSWIKCIRWKQLLVILIPLVFLWVHFYFESRPDSFLNHEFVSSWSISNLFKRSFVTQDGTMHYLLPNIVYAFAPFFHLGFFIIPLALIIAYAKRITWKSFKNVWILIVAIVLYSIFLAGIPFQNNRFLVLTYPFVLILLFPGFKCLCESSKKWLPVAYATLILVQLVLFVRAIQPVYQMNQFERELVAVVSPYEGSKMYCFYVDVSLKARGLNFEYVNLWEEPLETFEEGALVLFNEVQLKDQWTGKNPMINWESIKSNYALTTLEEMPNGWTLYRIGI